MPPKYGGRGAPSRGKEGRVPVQPPEDNPGKKLSILSHNLQHRYDSFHSTDDKERKKVHGIQKNDEGHPCTFNDLCMVEVSPSLHLQSPVALQKEGSAMPTPHCGATGGKALRKQSSQSTSPILWMAKKDLLLFCGPLGEPIGNVEEGTIIREKARYEDPFGGVWFSTIASDGSVVWLSFFDPDVHPMEDPGEMNWIRVFREDASPRSAVESKKNEDQSDVVEFIHPFRTPLALTAGGSVRNSIGKEKLHMCRSSPFPFATWCFSQEYIADLARGSEECPSDVVLIDYYWKGIMEGASPVAVFQNNAKNRTMDWNYRYQSALEYYFFGQSTAPILSRERVSPPSGHRIPGHSENSAKNKRHHGKNSSLSNTSDWRPVLSSGCSTGEVYDSKGMLQSYKNEVESCLREFRETAERCVVRLLEELVKPSSSEEPRTFYTHPLFRHVFYYTQEPLLLQIVVDSPSGMFGGSDSTVKQWRQRIRFMQMIAMESSKYFLSHPLYAMVTLKGMNVVVLAIPPISLARCVYAPLAEAHKRLEMPSSPSSSSLSLLSAEKWSYILPFCNALGRALNFKEHTVRVCTNEEGISSPNEELRSGTVEERKKDKHTWRTTMPVSTEIYAGEDERLYIFYASLSPPIPPLKGPKMDGYSLPKSNNNGTPVRKASPFFREENGNLLVSGLPEGPPVPLSNGAPSLLSRRGSFSSEDNLMFLPSQQLFPRARPEILRTLPQPINPDVCIQGCYNSEDEQQLLSISEYLRGNAISAAADIIGFHRALDGMVLHPAVAYCTLCGGEMTLEMRFIVCYHPEKCCRICSHCYCKRMSKAFNGAGGSLAHSGEEALTRVLFKDAVKCGYRSRKGVALLLEPTLSEILHSQGLNLSYLPFVRNRLPMASQPLMEHFLLAEMCARVGTKLLDSVLEATADRQEMHQCASTFLSSFLSSHGSVAETLWSKEVGPAMIKKYAALGGPVSLAYLSPELLAERIQDRSGVVLTTESFSSLRGASRKKIQGRRAESEFSSSRSPSASSVSSSSVPPSSFIEVEGILPRTRSFLTPHVTIEEFSGLERKLSASIEQLLLFWISCGSMSKSGKEAMAFYPFYLQK